MSVKVGNVSTILATAVVSTLSHKAVDHWKAYKNAEQAISVSTTIRNVEYYEIYNKYNIRNNGIFENPSDTQSILEN